MNNTPIAHARHVQTKQLGDVVYLNSDEVTVDLLDENKRVTWSRFLVELIEFGHFENEKNYVMGNVVERKGKPVDNE